MVKIMGNLGRQLNKLLGKNDFNNVEFKVDELESLQTIQLSKRDLAYAEYFKNVDEGLFQHAKDLLMKILFILVKN